MLDYYCGVVDMISLETKSTLLNVYFFSDAFMATLGFNLTYQQIKSKYDL